MFDSLRRRTPDPPGFDPDRVPASPRSETVSAPDGRYHCHVVDSPDGHWRLAYGRRTDGDCSRLFGIQDGDIRVTTVVARPAGGAIANSGTLAVVERGGSETTSCRIRVFDGETETMTRTVSSTVTDVVLSPDGSVVVVSTRQPDASVRAYNTTDGAETWTVTPRRATPRVLGFHTGDEQLLYVARERRSEPYLAVDADGEIRWGNERYQSTRPLAERVHSWVGRN